MRSNRFVSFLVAAFVVSFVAISCHRGQEKASAPGSDSVSVAIAQVTEKIALNVNDPALYEQRAKLYMDQKAYDKSLVDVRKAISLDGKNAEYFQLMADIELLMGKPQESQDALSHALTLSPENTVTLVKLAKLNLIIKDYPKTFQYVKQAIDLDPVNPQAYFVRALALLEKGDTAKAVGDLMKAVDQDQQFFDAYMTLGDLFSIRKDPLAASYFQNAVRIQPKSNVAMYRLGLFYQETGAYDKAIQTYQALQKSDTTFRSAPFNIGYIYLVYLQDFRQAAANFQEAIRRDPQYYEAWFNLGYANELTGNYTEAEKDYREALKIEVNYPKAIDGLNRLDARRIKK